MASDWVWSKPWVAVWLVFAFVVPWLSFVMPLLQWAILAGGWFGLQEGFALWHGRRYKDSRAAPYPPLTYIAVYKFPLWFTYTYTGLLVGALGGPWIMMFPHPVVFGGVFAFAFWTIEHWRTTSLWPVPERVAPPEVKHEREVVRA